MPLKRIPFPKITILDHVGAAMKGKSADLKQAKENQNQLKEEAKEAEKEPRVTKIVFEKNEKSIQNVREAKEIIVKATVEHIEDGESIDFEIIHKPISGEDESLISLSGIVKDGMVTAKFEVPQS